MASGSGLKKIAYDKKDDEEKVQLYVYDLADIRKWNNFRRIGSKLLLGEIPHVSIVVYGREFEVEEKGPAIRDLKRASNNFKLDLIIGIFFIFLFLFSHQYSLLNMIHVQIY